MPTVDTSTFHMVQLYLDPRRLVQLGKMQGLPLARTDTNYLVHCALGELFGEVAPKPFSSTTTRAPSRRLPAITGTATSACSAMPTQTMTSSGMKPS